MRARSLVAPSDDQGDADNRVACFKLLVDAGADVNDKLSPTRSTPLSFAAGYGHPKLVAGSFSDQAGHFGSSWPGGGERPPIRYEDSWGGLRGPSDTQLLIYSYIKR